MFNWKEAVLFLELMLLIILSVTTGVAILIAVIWGLTEISYIIGNVLTGAGLLIAVVIGGTVFVGFTTKGKDDG